MTVAEVRLWGRRIGAVSLRDGEEVAAFQYDPEFVGSGIEVSPMRMPLSNSVYRFPELERRSFHGLPGMLADALPDKFGNALIDTWLARQGRRPDSFNAVERLCYVGIRGMGALEFHPAQGPDPGKTGKVQVDEMVILANKILNQRGKLKADFKEGKEGEALQSILQVGTSAGGARAKAILAWNPETNEVRSGQVEAGEGFGYWLMKFDGVDGNRDKELADPKGFGAIEYAYSKMAKAAGIEMSECRLFEEGGRRHFMTRRFDRDEKGGKLHMQSFGGMAHLDFNRAGAYSYEQAMTAARGLGMPISSVEEQYRRMAFNIVARNQDDHVKNIAFLMDKAGKWSLSPAYDVTYSYNPSGDWTGRHQMTMAGKRDGFTLEDFRECEKNAGLKRGRGKAILEEVLDAVGKWPDIAGEIGVDGEWIQDIHANHRLNIPAK